MNKSSFVLLIFIFRSPVATWKYWFSGRQQSVSVRQRQGPRRQGALGYLSPFWHIFQKKLIFQNEGKINIVQLTKEYKGFYSKPLIVFIYFILFICFWPSTNIRCTPTVWAYCNNQCVFRQMDILFKNFKMHKLNTRYRFSFFMVSLPTLCELLSTIKNLLWKQYR